MSYSLTIGHIYPDLLDMYGDSGNIAALTKRLLWRGFDAQVKKFRSGDELCLENIDILILGGGSDAAQKQALSSLMKYKEILKNFIENGGTLLALCGGYPSLGKYIDEDGIKTPCLDILDIYTENQKSRTTGNVCGIADINGNTFSVVGFENHFGKTYIGNCFPFIKIGDKSEGVIYKNVFATYLHGPLLPKNPALADEILKRALKQKYGEEVSLPPLDDTLENKAHSFAENL